MLIGSEAVRSLAHRTVALFGVGGVGGYVAEVLARSGVGSIMLIDPDSVSETNINRQIVATTATVGCLKVDVMKQRIMEINPQCRVSTFPIFYLPQNAEEIPLANADYVVDCIDTITAKIEIIKRCHSLGIPVITCLGAANKLDATAFRVADLFSTKMDPLARVMRKKLRQAGITAVKCVYSEEQPIKPSPLADDDDLPDTATDTVGSRPKRVTPASNAFVPAAEGIIAAGQVIRDLISAHLTPPSL